MLKGIIYLDKQSLDLYAEKMTTIPRLAFPAGVVADLEILDVAKLDQAIKAFIDTHKILPAALSIVISPNLVFTKDIIDPKAAKVPVDPKNPAPVKATLPENTKDMPTLDELKQSFLETVPFDEVTHVTLPIQNGSKVIAANKTMYTYIKRAFEKYGFTVEGVTVLAVFGNTVLPVDQTIARKLLTKIDMVKQHNMLVVTPPPSAKKEGAFVITKPSETKDGNKRAFMMLGLFVVLFAIMGYMLYQMLNDPTMQKKPKKQPQVSAVVEPATPTPSVTDAPASASATFDFSELSFEIVSPTRNSSQAAELEEALEDAKAEDVTLVTRTSTTPRAGVAYSVELTPEEVTSLTSFMETQLPQTALREGEDLSSDVVITLPRE